VTQPGASNRQRHYANIFVGLTGLASFIFAGVGSYTGMPGGLDIGFLLAGAGLVALSPVAHKLQKFKFTGKSFEFEVAQELAVAEHQAIEGQVVEAVKGIASGEVFGNPKVTVTKPGGEIPVEAPPPPVVLTDMAAEELALFTPAELEAIAEELPKVGSDDGNEYWMRWGVQSHERYRVRRVGDDIRIFFRQREKTTVSEPDSFVVLGFAKANPGPGQGRLGRIPFR
jgi:hypothetical protein